MIETLIIILAIIAIIMIIISLYLHSCKEETQKTPTGIILKPDFNKELSEMVFDLEKKASRLNVLADDGLDLYNNIPKALKDSDRFKCLDDTSWSLLGAKAEIESAIIKIKEAML